MAPQDLEQMGKDTEDKEEDEDNPYANLVLITAPLVLEEDYANRHMHEGTL